ncbi:hypothetical protein [Azohydromonas aeria]|uniref:hypothetical protein n=1 Tax=Azohydromonas aeria TaxID=2590212 RepID=UPI0012F80020|nr:hypothetical protein [Azohydromonas aeria]
MTSNYFACQAELYPCWTCRHPRLSPVVGQPEHGRAFWEHELDADDDLLQL